MSNIIKLKRGLSSDIDTLTLERGELALTTDTNEILSVNDAGIIESITPHLLDNGKVKEQYLPEFSKENTTYVLTKNGNTITLTGSDGSSASIQDSDTKVTVDNKLNSTSTNPVQNKVVYETINNLPKIYMGEDEPIDLNVLLWIDTADKVLITFTVVSESFTAEENMTWGEWIASDYNPCLGDNTAFQDSGIVYYGTGLIQLQGSGVAVRSEHIIEPNGVYTGMAF